MIAWAALGTPVCWAQQPPNPPARQTTIVRPPEARRTPTPVAPGTRIIINVPASTPNVAMPAIPGYRMSGYTNGYGPPASGSAAYAGMYGYPGYGYSSSFGSPAYGYGAYASYYGYPGYNMRAPGYVVNGFGGSTYGPGLTPNLGFGASYSGRGLGAYGPAYSW
ncbi:MAG: hypothetical protein U0800_12180 [Isosphaeraceae bacterium]